jgi:hypothetical protein
MGKGEELFLARAWYLYPKNFRKSSERWIHPFPSYQEEFVEADYSLF